MPRLALYLPKNYMKKEKWIKIREMVKSESEILGIGYIEKKSDEEYPIIYLEDSETSTFIYVEDSEEDDIENIRAMIRVLTLVALLSEEKIKMGTQTEKSEREKLYNFSGPAGI